MPISVALWLGFSVIVVGLLALDLGLLHRKQRAIGVGEALRLSLGYFLLALVFAVAVFHFRGAQAGYEFLAGYLVEKSLSLDNIFVFVLIFGAFGVLPRHQHRVLFWGVIGALLMRAVLISAGTALIAAFHWVVIFFGGFLVLTGLKMLVSANLRPDLARNRIVAFLCRHLRVTESDADGRLFVRRDGLLSVTPLFLALVLVESADLVFAVDSIPAVFAITTDPFIVYTSNVFAILGLRALYFALPAVVHRFHYLKYGISLVLVAIGGKMLANGIAGAPIVPTELALALMAVLIGGAIGLSLLRPPRKDEPPAGWIPGSRQPHQDETLTVKEVKQ